jgi:hypothetical protein
LILRNGGLLRPEFRREPYNYSALACNEMSAIGDPRRATQIQLNGSDFRCWGDCVVKRGCFLQLVLIEHWSACDCDVLHCARLTELSTDSLVDRLRRAGGCGGWRWAAEELDEAAQVLSGCGQEHFIFGSAQAAQPQPVELKDALHVREPHLDFFTFAT